MWAIQRSVWILFGVVCEILCGISDLSGADTKIVRRVGNYGSEVSLSWRSHAQLQRLTGHRDSSTCMNWTFGSSGFVIGITDVTAIQHIWPNTYAHRSNASVEPLIIPVTLIFDYHDTLWTIKMRVSDMNICMMTV